MGSIHVEGVATAQECAWAAQQVIVEMRRRALLVGKEGGFSAEEFQGYMMYATASLDALKKMTETVEQAVRAFHRP
ncbi:MAG: hypothetical protein FJZ00_13290 [Candidatus Sericytochromatia bacterium]|jgi:hypothetical protein|uniref:Uncharacterized protein n=1 Tax=Candidatus Tanganyikabacteria bacterium TaxID=2961651 RepID=A0A937X9M2_9BACT|nr:hypothetical protein [Candidatus Tanganyikabacteria bacterium]